jgi:tetratricopeptide (TPR) repeat protein
MRAPSTSPNTIGDGPAPSERSAPRLAPVALVAERDAGTTHAALPRRDDRAHLGAWLVLVALLACVPYLNALPADFVFDDVGVVRDNPAVRVQPMAELAWYVYQPGALYRPLTMLTYAVTAMFTNAPAAYHAVNIVLHVGVSLAVFAVALLVLRGTAAAGIAALLFALHPVHTEAVTGIVGRAELLASLGVLGALLAFVRTRRESGGRRTAWYALSVALFAAALLAKESAATGIGLLAVVHWWLDRRAPLRRRLAALLPYACVLAAYLALRLIVVGTMRLPEPPDMLDNPLASVDALTRLRTAIVVLWDYVGLMVLPAQLSADYSYNQIPVVLMWSDPRFVLAAALLGGLTVALIMAARAGSPLLIAGLFTFIPLALTANVLFPIGTIKAERLLYLPTLGWCLAAGWLAAIALRRWPVRAAVVLVAVLGAYGVRTWVRNADWLDETALFGATVASVPASAKAQFNFAVQLERAGELDDAMLHYRRAREIYPDSAGAAFGIGRIYSLKDIENGAFHWYEKALQLGPRMSKAHLQIAIMRHARGEYDSALAALLTGLQTDPNNRLLLVTLAANYAAQGDHWRAADALAQLDRIGSLEPGEDELVAAARYEVEGGLQ